MYLLISLPVEKQVQKVHPIYIHLECFFVSNNFHIFPFFSDYDLIKEPLGLSP